MRIAIISDIHSNLAALERVFSFLDSKKIDEIFCLGDLVGYGPSPNECIEMIKCNCLVVVAGNHDWGATKKIPLKNFNAMGKTSLQWTQKQINDKNREYLQNLPLKIVRHDITIVHASPVTPENWTYIFSNEDVKEAFKGFTTPICFIGHTHIAVVINEDLTGRKLQQNTRSFINVGSVGQPRDGNPKISFGIFDLESWFYELVRLEYDIHKTVDAIKKAGLPPILGTRLINGY